MDVKNLDLDNSLKKIPLTSSFSHLNGKFSQKNKYQMLKVCLLEQLYELFCELFYKKIKNNFLMECYKMDAKIIQFLIQGILDTGEYTLEGIAYYTFIPFDVIYDAACGLNSPLTITSWARIADLYLQVRPDVMQALVEKLLQIKNKNPTNFSSLLKL